MKLSESLLIDIKRGNLVESEHLCDGVVVNAKGDIVMGWGDISREIYPRSAIKPVQALPLIETGAADHFGYSPAEVSFACASHNAESVHIEAVQGILERIGLGDDDFELGPPHHSEKDLCSVLNTASLEPRCLHNNCSGKHVGFLATAVHMGENPVGYIQPQHPVQMRVLEAMASLSNSDLSTTARGADGCGIPVVGMALSDFGLAMARMADPSGLGAVREEAIARIINAMLAHPVMVAGRVSFDTLVMQALDGVAVKTGAEGVQIAIVPERGLGIAFKARDGNSRGSEAAMMWVLDKLGLITKSAALEIAELIDIPVKNTLNDTVGSVGVRST